MNNKSYLILIAFFVSQSYNVLFPQWTLQNYDTTYSLFDIKFLNENTGFACGERYYPSEHLHRGVVYKTTNSGANWIKVFSDTSFFIHAIGFIDNNTILAGGGVLAVSQPKLLKSTNGGNNWFYTSPGEIDGSINSFAVFNNIVYATCVNGVFKSTNSGINWIRSTSGFSEFTNAFFLNAQTGWYAFDNGNIQKTTNGGANWINYSISSDNSYAHKIFFTNASTGYVIYDSMYTLTTRLLKTTNGGSNWYQLNPGLINHHWSIYFVNENTGYISGGGGNVIKTTDAGISWAVSWTGLNVSLLDIKFLDTYTGFACGGNSMIIKTTNGGFIGINPISTELPNDFSLSQNYPNPFNPTTNIRFALPKAAFVRLAVYDMLGREVELLVSQQLTAGTYVVDWNASKFSSGIYLYKLTTTDFNMVKKMSLIK
jgi:photosystem II stability/assembly factor-like uncharacterized protein